MANKPKIQYIRYYTPGSEALKLEPRQPAHMPGKKTAHYRPPVQRQVKPLVIAIDPVAVVAIVVAIVMAVMMASGISRLKQARQENQEMAAYVEMLEEKKQERTEYFHSGYSLEAVEKAALSLGMIPVEQAAHMEVEIPQVEVVEEPEPSFWDRVGQFFTGLFA